MKRVMARHHDAMPGHVHHASRHDSAYGHAKRRYDEDGAKRGDTCADCRLQEVYGIIAHPHEEVENREAEEKDDNA